MKILLTGANGFIGSHLVTKLLEQKHELIVIKRQSSDLHRINQYFSSIQFYNYEDLEVLNKIFTNKLDIIIHLAGVYLKKDTTVQDIHNINSFNIDFASQLAYRASKEKIAGFINTGTFFEYDLYHPSGLNEHSPLVPFNYYAASKIAFAKLLQYVTTTSNLKAVTLKLFSPYGEMDNDKIIPLILKSAITHKELLLQDSAQKLSFTYIDDVISAYLKAITFIQSNQFSYEDFNIGSDKSYSIKEIVDIVSNFTDQKVPLKHFEEQSRNLKTINVICDNSKAKKILGWYPETNIMSGLKKTYAYYKKII